MSEPWTQEQPRDDGWVDDDVPAAAEERAVGYLPDGLVTLRYLWDAIRRHSRLWIVTGLIGLFAGLAFPFVLPPPVEASTKLLVTHRNGDDPAQAIATDVRLATTETVAGRVVDDLDLGEPPNELLKRYTVVASTNRIVEITASAPTAQEAVRLTTAVATTFLEFRMEQVRAQQEPTARQLEKLQARASTLEQKVRKNGGSPDDTPKTGAALQLDRVYGQLEQVSHSVEEQDAAAALMSSSRTLDPASVVDRSAIRTIGVDIITGLAIGVVLGGGFVVARALLSDRLWRRQAIADALGARIGVSLGTLPVRWWHRVLRVNGDRAVEVAVDRLRENVHWSTTTTPTLAVVAVDELRASALLVEALARSYAVEGRRVLVADLSRGAALASRLGVEEAGVATVDADVAPVTVYVPDAEAGPAEGGLRRKRAEETNPLRQAWATAELVLTFTDLYPAQGGDHLRTWSAHAVAVVTAGRSTATRIHATGEMIRLAGVWLDFAVLLGQDGTDETVGQPAEPDAATSAVGVVGR